MGKFNYRDCCYYASWSMVVIVFFILCVTLLAGGAALYRKKNRENTMPFGMIETTCRLQTWQVTQCNDETWIASWNEGRVVESPFADRPTKREAELNVLAYPVNVSYPCMCVEDLETITPKCDAWNACTLNVNLTKHLQMTGAAYKYGGDILVAIGSIILVLVVTASFLMIITTGACACCCPKRGGGSGPDMSHFVIDTSEE